MTKHSKIIHRVFGILLIITGVILWPTPIPGTSLLIILGFVWVAGKKKTIFIFKEVLGKRFYRIFKIRQAIDDME